jgi:hypothetical protein
MHGLNTYLFVASRAAVADDTLIERVDLFFALVALVLEHREADGAGEEPRLGLRLLSWHRRSGGSAGSVVFSELGSVSADASV